MNLSMKYLLIEMIKIKLNINDYIFALLNVIIVVMILHENLNPISLFLIVMSACASAVFFRTMSNVLREMQAEKVVVAMTLMHVYLSLIIYWIIMIAIIKVLPL